MKLLNKCFSVVCLFITSVTYAADYYVDATLGDDANSGEQSTPWQTLKNINMNVDVSGNPLIIAGDNVYFKRGETWRETLVVPGSGSPDFPVTYSAYGSAADPRPVISCANDISDELWQGVIANGGFEQTDFQATEPFPGWTISGKGLVSQEPGYNSTYSVKLSIPENAGSGGFKTVPWHSEQDVQYNISGSVKALSANTKIEFMLYNSEAGNYKYLDSDMLWQIWDPTITGTGPGTRQPFHTVTSTTTSSNWEGFNLDFPGIAAGNVFLYMRIIGAGREGQLDNIKIEKVGVDYWSVPRGDFVPKILIEGGVRLPYGPEWDEAYQWHSVGGASKFTRYVPAVGTVVSDELIELGARRVAIFLNAKNHIVIDNLTVEGCDSFIANTSDFEGAGILLSYGSSNNTVSHVLAINNDTGIRVQAAGSNGEMSINNIFSDFEVAHSISQGIALRNFASNNIIQNCKVHDIAGLDSDNLSQDKEGISIGGTTGNGPGNIIQNCEIYNIGLTADSKTGPLPIFNSPNTIVRYNYIHDVGLNAVGVSSNTGPVNGEATPGFTSSGTEIYYNVIARTGVAKPLSGPGQGITVGAGYFTENNNIKVNNNTIIDCETYDNKDAGIAIRGTALQCVDDGNGDCVVYEGFTPVEIAGGRYYQDDNGDYIVGRVNNLQVKNNSVAACKGRYTRALFVGTKKNPSGAIEVINPDINNNIYNPGTNTARDWLIAFGEYSVRKQYAIDEFGPQDQPDTYLYDANLINPGQDNMSLVADSLYIDADNLDVNLRDYHLDVTSVAIDKGVDVGLSRDFEGNAVVGLPDIGAYEYVDTDNDGIQNYLDDDIDEDEYLNADDCNPYDDTIYPGALEVVRDDIDQDCNGFDLTTRILSAIHKGNTLTVRAESWLPTTAILTLDGYGDMGWKIKKGVEYWELKVRGVTNPGTVTVTSSEGTTLSFTVQ